MLVDTRTISKFLSDEETDFIREFMDQDDPQINRWHSDQSHTQGIWLGLPFFKPVADILMPKLHAEFGTDLIIKNGHCHVLNTITPFGTHNDVSSTGFVPNDKTEAAWTFIIPFADYDSHTIVFNEHSEYTKTVWHWQQENNIPAKNAIDDETYEKYFSHIWRTAFDCLTIEAIFPWRKGDLFAASRKKFHCSDNYPLRGLDTKRALIIWTELPKVLTTG